MPDRGARILLYHCLPVHPRTCPSSRVPPTVACGAMCPQPSDSDRSLAPSGPPPSPPCLPPGPVSSRVCPESGAATRRTRGPAAAGLQARSRIRRTAPAVSVRRNHCVESGRILTVRTGTLLHLGASSAACGSRVRRTTSEWKGRVPAVLIRHAGIARVQRDLTGGALIGPGCTVARCTIGPKSHRVAAIGNPLVMTPCKLS